MLKAAAFIAATLLQHASSIPHNTTEDGITNSFLPEQFRMDDCNGFSLEETTIEQLQSAYQIGTLTTVQVASCYLERIQQTNGWLRSV
jgi:hypothetical protein